MAESMPLAELLDQAGNVTLLAGKLASAFKHQHESGDSFVNHSNWREHSQLYEQFDDAIVRLAPSIEAPPSGFETLVSHLRQAGELSRNIGKSAKGSVDTEYRDFVPNLNSLCASGGAEIDRLKQAITEDRYAFLNKPSIVQFTNLDRFPATAESHMAFLEWVRDEVRDAAKAKKTQFENGYSNQTIEKMVSGIKWREASARLAALSEVPNVHINIASEILGRQLTAGTVEQISAKLVPAMHNLREWFEWELRLSRAEDLIVVKTAGDLWRAYSDGKQPCFQCSGISMKPGSNMPIIDCPNEDDESLRMSLDAAEALVTLEGGDKAAAMEMLMARIQVQKRLDKRSVINMSLSDFVSAATDHHTMTTQPQSEDLAIVNSKVVSSSSESNIPPTASSLHDAIHMLLCDVGMLRKQCEPAHRRLEMQMEVQNIPDMAWECFEDRIAEDDPQLGADDLWWVNRLRVLQDRLRDFWGSWRDVGDRLEELDETLIPKLEAVSGRGAWRERFRKVRNQIGEWHSWTVNGRGSVENPDVEMVISALQLSGLPDWEDETRQLREFMAELKTLRTEKPTMHSFGTFSAQEAIAKFGGSIGKENPPSPTKLPNFGGKDVETKPQKQRLDTNNWKDTPKLDKQSADWVINRDAAKMENVETRTLAKYRDEGEKQSDRLLGRDRDGRIWRKPETANQHPWYFVPSLKSQRGNEK